MEKLTDNKFRSEFVKKTIFQKRIIDWHNKLRGVTFDENIKVKLIPSRKEIDNIHELWWSHQDIEKFRINYYICLTVENSFN